MKTLQQMMKKLTQEETKENTVESEESLSEEVEVKNPRGVKTRKNKRKHS